MKKKIVALCLVICLAATAIAGASLAYFTDTDKAKNKFTSGYVDIELIEQQRGEGDALVDFEQGKNLVPYTGEEGTQDLSKNYVDKIVTVKNKGSEPAYVRVLVAVPAILKDANALHIDWNTEDWTLTEAPEITIQGTKHDVYVVTYNTPLAKKEVTKGQAMYGMYLDPTVDYDIEGMQYICGTGKNKVGLGGFDLTNTIIPVFAQSVQSAGFESADAAFAAAGFSTDPWNNKR